MAFSKKVTLRVALAVMLTVSPIVYAFSSLKVSAASVVSYIDMVADGVTNNPATVTTPPEVAASAANQQFYISYVASTTEFASTNTITIDLPVTFTNISACTAGPYDADGDATNDSVSFTLSGSSMIYTFNAATSLATTSGVELCVEADMPAAVGNYSVGIADTNDNDTSAALIYVGDDNDVTVTASVPVTMALRIKEPTTTLDTNSCNLGVLNPAATNTCSYRIAAGTNNANGMDVYVVGDNQLNTAGDTADINDITDDVLNAGTEEHGIIVAVGTGWTVQSNFHATNYEDINTTADAESQEGILSAAGAIDDSNTANWSTITHGASVSTATPGGSYNEVVTYRAFAGI